MCHRRSAENCERGLPLPCSQHPRFANPSACGRIALQAAYKDIHTLVNICHMCQERHHYADGRKLGRKILSGGSPQAYEDRRPCLTLTARLRPFGNGQTTAPPGPACHPARSPPHGNMPRRAWLSHLVLLPKRSSAQRSRCRWGPDARRNVVRFERQPPGSALSVRRRDRRAVTGDRRMDDGVSFIFAAGGLFESHFKARRAVYFYSPLNQRPRMVLAVRATNICDRGGSLASPV